MEERLNRRRPCKGLRWHGRQGPVESRRIRWEVALRQWISKEGGRSSEHHGQRNRSKERGIEHARGSGPRHSEVEEALKRGCLAVKHDVPMLPKKSGANK